MPKLAVSCIQIVDNFNLRILRSDPMGGLVVESVDHDSQLNKMNCQSILNVGVSNFEMVGEQIHVQS